MRSTVGPAEARRGRWRPAGGRAASPGRCPRGKAGIARRGAAARDAAAAELEAGPPGRAAAAGRWPRPVACSRRSRPPARRPTGRTAAWSRCWRRPAPLAAPRPRLSSRAGGIGTAAADRRAGASARRSGPAAAVPALSLVRQVFRSTTDEAATLSLLAEQEAEAGRLVRHADALQRTVGRARAKAAKAESWLGSGAERRERLRRPATTPGARRPSCPAASAAAQVAAERARRRLRRDELVGELGCRARHAPRRWSTATRRPASSLQELRGRRLAGMAAELAAGLAPGERLPGLRQHRASPSGDGEGPP